MTRRQLFQISVAPVGSVTCSLVQPGKSSTWREPLRGLWGLRDESLHPSCESLIP